MYSGPMSPALSRRALAQVPLHTCTLCPVPLKTIHIPDTQAEGLAHLPWGSRMLLTPPSLTLIFKQRLDKVCGVVLCTFFICTHCVAIPSTVSPTRLTSAAEHQGAWVTFHHRPFLCCL